MYIFLGTSNSLIHFTTIEMISIVFLYLLDKKISFRPVKPLSTQFLSFSYGSMTFCSDKSTVHNLFLHALYYTIYKGYIYICICTCDSVCHKRRFIVQSTSFEIAYKSKNLPSGKFHWKLMDTHKLVTCNKGSWEKILTEIGI